MKEKVEIPVRGKLNLHSLSHGLDKKMTVTKMLKKKIALQESDRLLLNVKVRIAI